MFWHQNPGIYYIITNTANINSGTWPAPVLYTKNNQFDVKPAPVPLKNGTLVLFFASNRSTGFDIYSSRYNAGQWSAETRLTTNPSSDQSPTATQDSAGRIWLAWTRRETGDIKVRFVDSNSNLAWGPGESVVYDSNGNGVYDLGESVILGIAPSAGTTLQVDSRLEFIDANGDAVWNPGEFVMYDPDLDVIYNPKLKIVDSNNDNVWSAGETMAYDADSDDAYTSHTGVGNCTGSNPTLDCVIIGSVPANHTIVKTDMQVKFVDLNGDAVWQRGEMIVYDTNGNGLYDTGERTVAALTNDPKLKFIGPGSSWSTGNTVVYDTNGNNIYDSKIKFVDTNLNGYWNTGETVVSDTNLNSQYDFADTVVFEVDPEHIDLGRTLLNDPALKFLDSNSNGVWDSWEAVVSDSNLNNLYDGTVKFVDLNSNNSWDTGEAVVQDTDSNFLYSRGTFHNDTLIAGPTPANNTALRQDPKLKFYDANGNTSYDTGERMAYDANGNSVYDAADILIVGPAPPLSIGLTAGLGEGVVVGSSPAIGASVKADSKIKYAESNANGLWDPGENMLYDMNGNNVYDTGEPVVVGIAPAQGTPLQVDPHLKYADTNGNLVWDSAEAIVYDANLNNIRDLAEALVRGVIPQPGNNLTVSLGEPLIAGLSPAPGTELKTDGNVKFVDLNANLVWGNGEPVGYDANNNGIFDTGDTIIAGDPVPSVGTALKVDEFTLAGTIASTGTALRSDLKIKFVDTNGNNLRDNGEPVAYDMNSNNVYDTGETVIAGSPTVGQALKTDSRLKFSDSKVNNVWDNGEPVFLSSDNTYDASDTIVAVFRTPAVGATLRSDTKVKYFETGTDTNWDLGESVVYDSNNNGVYDSGELTISGPTPSSGTLVSIDSKLKFVDSNGNIVWDRGEAVVYDSTTTNNLYDTGEPVLVSNSPAGGTPLKAVLHIFYKTYTGAAWSAEQRLTTQPNSDKVPSITNTLDGRVWVAWSGERGGPSKILTRTTSDGTSWTPETAVTDSTGTYGDNDPSMTQDRNGTIWIVWGRNVPCSCGQAAFQEDMYSINSINNGATWTPAAILGSTTTGQDEIQPNISQLNDKKLYIFFSILICGGSTCTVNIYYLTTQTQILIHNAHMNSLTANTTSLRAGQTLRLKANVTNLGDYADTFLVTVKANSTFLPTNSSTVSIGETKVIIIKWGTGGMIPGRYILTANVTTTGEGISNMFDNVASLTILIRPGGDVNADCRVDIADLGLVGATFGKSAGQPGFNPAADLNNDGTINIADLSAVGSTFGQKC